jgi:hypothetical protein
LIEWNRGNVSFDAPYVPTAECLRVQKALLSMPRKYGQWLKDVCGQQTDAQEVKQTEQRKANVVIPIHGVKCPNPSCGLVRDSFEVTNSFTYPNGNISRRHVCPSCKTAFRTMFYAKNAEKKD